MHLLDPLARELVSVGLGSMVLRIQAMIHAVTPFEGFAALGERRLLHRIGLEGDWLPPRPACAKL